MLGAAFLASIGSFIAAVSSMNNKKKTNQHPMPRLQPLHAAPRPTSFTATNSTPVANPNIPEGASMSRMPSHTSALVQQMVVVIKKRKMEDGGWRLEDGGWRLEVGGWRMEVGGWRMYSDHG